MAGGNKPEYPPLLPLGFHPKGIEDVRRLCVSRFPRSITRTKVMEGLEHVVGVLNSTSVPMEVWIDGSFMTDKLNPDDSDIAVRVLSTDYDMADARSKAVLKWASETDLKPDHRCDCYPFTEYPPGHKLFDHGQWMRAYWLRQFGFTRAEEPKGLAVVKLPFIIT